MYWAKRREETEQGKMVRLVQEYMQLGAEFDGAPLKTINEDLSGGRSAKMGGPSRERVGTCPRYRRLREIEDYLKGLTAEDFVGVLSRENFPPTDNQVHESNAYQDLDLKYKDLQARHKSLQENYSKFVIGLRRMIDPTTGLSALLKEAEKGLEEKAHSSSSRS